jgi:hypothetical protein
MEMHVVIESRSEAVQKGDGAESRASDSTGRITKLERVA